MGAPVNDLAFGLRKRNDPVVHRGACAFGLRKRNAPVVCRGPFACLGTDGQWDGTERRVAKRRKRRVYRFHERRHGFDRRKRYPVLGTMRDHPRIVTFVVVLLGVLSTIDGMFTLAEVGLGIASEGNPVLAAAGEYHLLFAIAAKVGGTVVAIAAIWHGRRRRSILFLSLVALAAFAAVVAYHVGSLVGLGWL